LVVRLGAKRKEAAIKTGAGLGAQLFKYASTQVGRILAAGAICLAVRSADAETGLQQSPGLQRTTQWDIFDCELAGPADGNPFIDVQLSATFIHGATQEEATGYYDGAGRYHVHFMPDQLGGWKYTTRSNVAALDGKTGEFDVDRPSKNNHGPVQVRNTYHFAYADGTPYKPLGTTCYAWIQQGDALEEQTLRSLAASPFNKVRMCVFPKWYEWNHDEPPLYPFEGTAPNHWDFARFNPTFFQHLEKCVANLRDIGIEADVILFHPYDHWGFSRMPTEADDRYLRYVVARLSAYRNVWWSLANEYDFMRAKQESDWDRLLEIVKSSDPYDHLRSIHNGLRIYNHTDPLITHASIQNGSAAEDAGRAVLYRDVYRKPIVFDEIKYEGNIDKRWGNLSGEEMVHRFWECIVAGTYPGHGECILDPSNVLWWSKGGVLRGESPDRIAFLRDVLATSPADGIEPIDKWQSPNIGGRAGQYYLIYFGREQPEQWRFALPHDKLTSGMKFHVDILDTWNMTVKAIDQPFVVRKLDDYSFVDESNRVVELPARPWMALRITRLSESP
jgi:hypothetical protein